jgi:hypothetical protein
LGTTTILRGLFATAAVVFFDLDFFATAVREVFFFAVALAAALFAAAFVFVTTPFAGCAFEVVLVADFEAGPPVAGSD